MSYLLDTHYILWSLFEPDRIGKKVKRILVDEEQTKYVSGISIWEISLKYSIGKLELIDTNPDEIIEKVKESGFELLNVENLVLASYYQLPKKEHHKDPFDRMLIWQAITNNLTLLSKDTGISQYVDNGLKIESGK
ncbi:MAG: type II toxin-antitoxin system VapC family toxin [Deltaproteobacteria bacterium]|jgi:PIN domain nuclease of toxin-antitoxin system|nr:type II toxin-antitoxin system VapC family toxin [Deltaproteobacteria bacterium]MBT4526308.1 type II toxin-antitoxin system VapC family toxin [Deltaproteobacteria bacterium]